VSDTPLFPEPVYGLRTWTVVGDRGAERLAAPQRGDAWPPGGVWAEASCARSPEHRAPADGCVCGLHALHPSRRSARLILSGRREIPGIVEARGQIEVHEDGFRAERARPYVLLLLPGRNARLLERLGKAYGAEVVEVNGADAVATLCRERTLGLDESGVAQLLGPATAERYRRARRERMRAAALRLAAVVVLSVLLVVAGLALLTDPPGERVLNGRTGEITVNSR
jgi:hypothetical protein